MGKSGASSHRSLWYFSLEGSYDTRKGFILCGCSGWVLFFGVKPHGFAFKGGYPTILQFSWGKGWSTINSRVFSQHLETVSSTGVIFQGKPSNFVGFPSIFGPPNPYKCTEHIVWFHPSRGISFLNHQHVGFPKIFRYQKPFFTTRTSLWAIPQLLRPAQVRYVASGNYGLVYRVLRMVDSAKQQAAGGLLLFRGLHSTINPWGVKSMESC
jgi:hypothetical protein